MIKVYSLNVRLCFIDFVLKCQQLKKAFLSWLINSESRLAIPYIKVTLGFLRENGMQPEKSFIIIFCENLHIFEYSQEKPGSLQKF
jgi:hypothetical protein